MTDREKLIGLLDEATDKLKELCGGYNDGTGNTVRADRLIANGVTFATNNNVGDKRIKELEAKLAEREEAVCNLRKKWQAAETHICTMCGHFDHKTDGNIVYGNKSCGELVGYPCCGKFTPWIPVTDRLPEEFTSCIVYRIGSFGGHYSMLRYSPELGWHFYDSEWGDVTVNDVTHWMPLPEPPKGE